MTLLFSHQKIHSDDEYCTFDDNKGHQIVVMVCYVTGNKRIADGFIYKEVVLDIRKFMRKVRADDKIDLLESCKLQDSLF